MAEVSFFQRYSQKENVVTNNTLLLLRVFYQRYPSKLERALNQIGEGELNIGLNFTQQTRAGSSVPDAIIQQHPLTIFIETKLGGDLDINQMTQHLKAAVSAKKHGGDVWLVGLTKAEISDQSKEQLMAMQSEGVVIETITFGALSDLLRKQCSEYDVELMNVLDDYVEFLKDSDLLSEYDRMTVVPCGKSLDLNVKFKVYFEPADRPSKAASSYVGLYAEKAVRRVGIIKSVFEAVEENDQLKFLDREPPENDVCAIKSAILAGKKIFGDFMASEHRFYVVEEFHKTNFKKVSKYGIWGPRVFKLSEALGVIEHDWSIGPADVSIVADGLNQQVFT